MPAMLLRSIVPSLVLAAAFAAPAQAAPAWVKPLKSCYVVAQANQRETIEVSAQGFTALKPVEIFVDEVEQKLGVYVQFDGTISGTVLPPFFDAGTRPLTVRVTEVDNPANTLVANSMVTRLAVEQTPRSAPTDAKVRFKGRGFMVADAPVYAHYVFAGRIRKTARLKVPSGPCGTFSVRAPQFPFKKAPDRGKWTIQFDQNPTYSAEAPVRVQSTIRVKKTPKRGPAPAR